MYGLRVSVVGLLAVTSCAALMSAMPLPAQARSRPILAECVNPQTGVLVGSSFCNCRFGWNAARQSYWIRHSAAFCSRYGNQNFANLGPARELGLAPGRGGGVGSGGPSGAGSGLNGGGGPGGAGGGLSGGGGAGGGGSGSVANAGNPGNDNPVGAAGDKNPGGAQENKH